MKENRVIVCIDPPCFVFMDMFSIWLMVLFYWHTDLLIHCCTGLEEKALRVGEPDVCHQAEDTDVHDGAVQSD